MHPAVPFLCVCVGGGEGGGRELEREDGVVNIAALLLSSLFERRPI